MAQPGSKASMFMEARCTSDNLNSNPDPGFKTVWFWIKIKVP